MKLAEAIRLYLNTLTVKGRSLSMLKGARSVLLELATVLAGPDGDPTAVELEQLDAAALVQFRETLAWRLSSRGQPLAVRSQLEKLRHVRGLCRWLVEEQILLSDPSRSLTLPKKPKQLPRGLLEPEDIQTLLAQPNLRTPTGYRDRVVLELLYATGLRRTEVANLTLRELDTRAGTLIVRQGKGGKDRVVPLGDALAEWLESYIHGVRADWPGQDNDHHLFLNRFGVGLSPEGVWAIVNKTAQQAGSKKTVSTHSFRHACATHMLRNGAPIRHIQELLGHESLETTQIYTHVTITDLKAMHRRYHPSEQEILPPDDDDLAFGNDADAATADPCTKTAETAKSK